MEQQTLYQENGLIEYRSPSYQDSRGYYTPFFDAGLFKQSFGIDFDVTLISRSVSNLNVIRGLHFQKPPYEQAKIVTVCRGSVLDVSVDLRASSKNFGQVYYFELSAVRGETLYIPRGFAHGFITQEVDTEFLYFVDNQYQPDYESGIIFNDPQLNISWGKIDPDDCIISDKDKSLPKFVNDRNRYFPEL